MHWSKFVLNPQSLEGLYENVPELENVELFSINLNREGSNIEICFDLPRFPEHPSKRWHPEFNTIQLKLNFWRVTDFKAKGWQSNMTVSIDVERNEELIKVVLSDSKLDIAFSFLCETFRIDSVTGYQNLK